MSVVKINRSLDNALMEQRRARRATGGKRLRPTSEDEQAKTGDVDRLDRAMRAVREARKSSSEIRATQNPPPYHVPSADVGRLIAPLLVVGLAVAAVAIYVIFPVSG